MKLVQCVIAFAAVLIRTDGVAMAAETSLRESATAAKTSVEEIRRKKNPNTKPSSKRTYFLKGTFEKPNILDSFGAFANEAVEGAVKCNVTETDLSCFWALQDGSPTPAILSASYIWYNTYWYSNKKGMVYSPNDEPLFGMCGSTQAAQRLGLPPFKDTYQPMKRSVPDSIPTWPLGNAVRKPVSDAYFWDHCMQFQKYKNNSQSGNIYGTANEKWTVDGKDAFSLLIDVATGKHNTTAFPISYVFHAPRTSNYYLATNYTDRGFAVAFLGPDSDMA